MKKRLLIITDDYPYGQDDLFVSFELEFLLDYFSISIASTNIDDMLYSNFEFKCELHRIDVKINPLQIIYYFARGMLKSYFWSELQSILKKKKLNWKRILQISITTARIERFKRKLLLTKILLNQDLIYSYWHTYKVLAVGLALKEIGASHIPIVSRTHGYDLFNERVTRGRRQPFLPYMDKFLHSLFFISKHGRDYYQQEFGFIENCSYKISRLGVFGPVSVSSRTRDTNLTLLCVANAIPLKRVELIIEALALINSYTVSWTYIGAGESLQTLKQLAGKLLDGKPNVRYEFLGFVPNEVVQDFYQQYAIDAFILTSSSEGLPVSIQEAFSYGVPAISTSVGGVPEIIENGKNGFLLSNNPSPEEIVRMLDRIMLCKKSGEWQLLSDCAQKTWEKEYNAKHNFKDFSHELLLIANNTIN